MSSSDFGVERVTSMMSSDITPLCEYVMRSFGASTRTVPVPMVLTSSHVPSGPSNCPSPRP